MSAFTTLIVTKPKYFRIEPKRSGFGDRERYVIGFDSEAVDGAPICLQFAHPDGRCDLIETTADDCLSDFLSYIQEECVGRWRTKREYVIVGWNLRYEYTQLFRNLPSECFQQPQFILHHHEQGICSSTPGKEDDDYDVRLSVLNDKRYAFRMWIGKQHRAPVKMIDGMAYFSTSLAKAAGIVGMQKQDYPEGLGRRAAHLLLADPVFVSYAKQDALITQKVGEVIVNYHRVSDVPMTISAPMFAAYVFKRKYLDGEIPLCDPEIEAAGLKSYHGGKNGCYIDRPRFYPRAYDYDINGAYSSAMAILPDPVQSVWYDRTEYQPGIHAIWYVRGWVRPCVYRAIQEVSGRWITHREREEQSFWVTSYELDVAIDREEIELLECSGYEMIGPVGGSLAHFVEDMYQTKRFAPTAEERLMAKLCLNSVYGKFIQKVPTGQESVYPMFDLADDDEELRHQDSHMVPGGYRAGGLYHPAIASLITGNVRAQIHRYEHKYDSLMTSTDGFLSLVSPDPTDIGPELGKLKMKEGSLSLWRERLYWFDADDGDDAWALHGFRAKLQVLQGIPLEPGIYDYRATGVVGLRDSLRLLTTEHGQPGRRFSPGQFVDLPFQLDLRDIGARSPMLAGNV